jgi:tetratricopeptide (TPR) repeat protein
MYELKALSRDAIPEALSKVERYRLLNEPAEAESICRDVLRTDPDNQQAVVMLVLTLTDQFHRGLSAKEAKDLIPRLQNEYDRAYYRGIIAERWAKTLYEHDRPGSASTAYAFFREAMDWFDKAEALRPPGNDDAILRWNTCARLLMRDPRLQPRPEEGTEALLLE